MAYCPFSLVKEVVKERKVSKTGEILEEKETPTFHLIECLREKCEVFDVSTEKCSIPRFTEGLRTLQDIQAKQRQVTSELLDSNSMLLADLIESNSGLLSESRLTKDIISKIAEQRTSEIPSNLTETLKPLFDDLLSEMKTFIRENKETSKGMTHLIDKVEELTKKMDTGSLTDILEKLSSQVEEGKTSAVEFVMQNHLALERLNTSSQEANQTLLSLRESLQTFSQSQADMLKDEFAQGRKISIEEGERLKGSISSLENSFASGLKDLKNLFEELNKTNKETNETYTKASSSLSSNIQSQLEKLEKSLQNSQEIMLSAMADENRGNIETLSSKFDAASELSRQLLSSQGEINSTIYSLSNTLKDSFSSSSQEMTKAFIQSLEELQKSISTGMTKLLIAQGDIFSSLSSQMKESNSQNLSFSQQNIEEIKALKDSFASNLKILSEELGREAQRQLATLDEQSLLLRQILEADSKLQDAGITLNSNLSSSFSNLTSSFTDSLELLRNEISETKEPLNKLLLASEHSARFLASIISESTNNSIPYFKEIQNELKENSKNLETLANLLKENSQIIQSLRESLTEILSDNLKKTQELLLAPGEREEKLDRITQEIALSTKSLSTYLSELKTKTEEEEKERRREKAKDHNNRGVSLYHQQAYKAAEAEFKKALELNPSFTEAHNNLALTLSELGRSEEAIESFKRAIELSPEFAEAYNNLACLYQLKGEYEEAIQMFNQAIQARADYSTAYTNLGSAYQTLNRIEEAEKSWERAIAIDPTNDVAKRKLEILRGG